MKVIYIIAGCNGAGKTTASLNILPDILECKEFINADEIAKGISPFQPEKVAIEAGRIMLKRIETLIERGENFAFETTLATKTYRDTIIKVKSLGYEVILLFFWLKNAEMAKRRVEKRVQEGGHNIDEEVIERRYKKGIQNLFNIYLPIVDTCLIFDNSEGIHQLIAQKVEDNFEVLNKEKYNNLKNII